MCLKVSEISTQNDHVSFDPADTNLKKGLTL